MSFDSAYLQSLSQEDLNLYFADTYLKILLPGSEVFRYFYIENFEGDYRSGNVQLNGVFSFKENPPFDIERKTFKSRLLKFDFTFPEPGFYTYKDNAYLYSQRSIRQNKKGIHHINHNISPLLGPSNLTIASNRYSFLPAQRIFGFSDRVNSLFTSIISHPIDKVINKVLKGETLSGVLSRDFAVTIGIKSTTPSIWFKSNLVGDLISPQKIAVLDDIFYQETIDFFSQYDIDCFLC